MIVRISFVIIVIAFGVLGGWIGYMAIDNEPPYVWDASKSRIIPDPVRQGGTVSVEWKMKVNRVCPGSSQRILTDATTGHTVETYDATPAALSVTVGDNQLNRTFNLPPRKLPPVVGYRSTLCFSCNKLQAFFPLCVTTPTLTFRVEG